MTQDWLKNTLMAIAFVMPSTAFAQDEAIGREPEPIFVQTFTVPSETTPRTRQFFGQVSALETVDISFEVGGYLAELAAQEGSNVTAGTPLASLDLAPFERAVERAELALAQATRDYTREQELAARNVSSEVRAKNALTARDLADVALREAREALTDAQIVAPFDGLVADRIATAFTTIEPGQPILRLHNMSELRVEFDLPERVLAQIGDPAEVAFEGRIAGRATPIDLSFREFRAETGGIGQSYTISLAAENTNDALLLPGRTMIVRALLSRASEGVILPATAIATRPGGDQVVAVVVPDGDVLRAQLTQVDVTTTNGTTFNVFGLAPGTEVIEVGAHLISDGQVVKRFTGLTIEGI